MGKWLRKQQIDVINTHSSTDSWLVALARSLGFYQGAIVRTRHVSAPIKPSMMTRWLYNKGCDFVVTTGEKLRQQVINQVGLPSDKVQSIPTGIDLAQFKTGDKQQVRHECGLPQEKVIIGIVATLRSWKGHQYLIEALAQLQRSDLLILIVGEGPNRPNIEQVIQKQGLSEQVMLVGNQINVVPWLQAMDVFVLPSYANEGVPQSLMQAMACGLPVISTSIGSIDELIHEGLTGRLVAPQQTMVLAQVLSELINNPQQCEQLAQQGRARVQSTCSLPVMLSNMQAVFERVQH